jgi:Zn-dependent M28 family amino/carboxypeptidase
LLSGATLMITPEQLNNYVPPIYISSTLGQKLAGKKVNKIIKLRDKITQTGKPTHTTIPVDVHLEATHQIKSTPSVNVLGYVEGIDPVLKDEVVIVTAHYDHLGMRGNDIFFGADDNASGTSGVMEIAQAFAQAKSSGNGPKRSVLCMLVTGEEKGLLGSQYYVEHPIFPLAQTVADVNIDMIGRNDEKHPDSNYTYVIGSDRLSTELHHINETVNQLYTKLQLDYTYNMDSDPNRYYYRSDHYNFAKNGIPVIFYFSGAHADYHRPTDTPDKIRYEKAEAIARLAFHTAWELANRDERIKVDVTGRN